MVSISTIYNSEDIKESLTKQSIKQKKNIYIYIYIKLEEDGQLGFRLYPQLLCNSYTLF